VRKARTWGVHNKEGHARSRGGAHNKRGTNGNEGCACGACMVRGGMHGHEGTRGKEGARGNGWCALPRRRARQQEARSGGAYGQGARTAKGGVHACPK
jgi:hypothetical protein